MANDVSPRIGGADRVEIRTSGTPPTSLGTLAVAVVIVVSLYFGREVFVPVALAILLSFALGPLVLLLRRWHLGRVPAVIVAVLLAFSIIGGVGTFVGTQLAHLAGDLPEYQTNVAQKIHSLWVSTGGGWGGRANLEDGEKSRQGYRKARDGRQNRS
jgi:predicted PurR-regulated permease PerM